MEALKNFIDKNYSEFSNLEYGEWKELELNDPNFTPEVIDYLKSNYRFDYKGIYIYYREKSNQIWVENTIDEIINQIS